jgi:hypothetical protein
MEIDGSYYGHFDIDCGIISKSIFEKKMRRFIESMDIEDFVKLK